MPLHCLVMLRTPLVAQDLALTLEDLTGSTAILAETPEDACASLAGLAPGELLYAFLQSDADALRDSALLAHVLRLGGRTVLLGHAAETEAARGEGCPEWPVLAQPFGAAQVAELLERLPPLAKSV